MVLSFSWFRYSVYVGFLKKKVEAVVRVAPDKHWSGTSWPVPSEGQKSGTGKDEKKEAIESLFELAVMVKAELRITIRECSFKNLGKQELLLSLHNLLKPYTALAVRQAYAFWVAINNTIEIEVEKYYPYHISGKDLLMLWQPRAEGNLC